MVFFWLDGAIELYASNRRPIRTLNRTLTCVLTLMLTHTLTHTLSTKICMQTWAAVNWELGFVSVMAPKGPKTPKMGGR